MHAIEQYIKTEHLEIENFEAENGVNYVSVPLFLRVYGQPLRSAPLILLDRGLLPGRSSSGRFGDFHKIVGKGKFVDLSNYSLIELVIPTDRYLNLAYDSYEHLSHSDIQKIIAIGLDRLHLPQPYASFRFD